MATYGYARISTRDQSHRLQLDALQAAGCDEIVQETGSGVRDRPVLTELLARLQPGDVLVTWKMDRLGRSARGVLDVLADLRDREVVWRSLTEGMDSATTIGRLGLHILAGVAEMERELLLERIGAGIAARRKAGGSHGRPPEIDAQHFAHARQLLASGHSIRQTARLTGIPRSTLADTLRRRLDPAPAVSIDPLPDSCPPRGRAAARAAPQRRTSTEGRSARSSPGEIGSSSALAE